MRRSLRGMLGADVSTLDGALGRLLDVYYDDRLWTVRYLAVGEIGEDGAARLVSPLAVERVGGDPERITLALDLERMLAAPDLTLEQPVSLQAEKAYFDFFGWPYYWEGPYAWGAWGVPTAPMPPFSTLPAAGYDAFTGEVAAPESDEATPPEGSEASHHLRSADETIGYHVQALDGEIGHTDDFLADERSWHITTVVVNTRNWWFGKKVELPVREVTHVDWGSQLMFVDVTRDQVREAHEADDPPAP